MQRVSNRGCIEGLPENRGAGIRKAESGIIQKFCAKEVARWRFKTADFKVTSL